MNNTLDHKEDIEDESQYDYTQFANDILSLIPQEPSFTLQRNFNQLNADHFTQGFSQTNPIKPLIPKEKLMDCQTGVQLSKQDYNHDQTCYCSNCKKQTQKEATNKCDIWKNIYPNSTKEVIKSFISPNSKRVIKIHNKLGITNISSSLDYIKGFLNWQMSLKDLALLLNDEQGPKKEKIYKKAFLIFYRWFIRHKYPVHIINSNPKHKNDYLQVINYLLYLPEIKFKTDKKRKISREQKNAHVQIRTAEISTQVTPDDLKEVNQLCYKQKSSPWKKIELQEVNQANAEDEHSIWSELIGSQK